MSTTTDVALRDSTPATISDTIDRAAAVGGGLTNLSDEAARLLWRDCVAFSKTNLVAGPLQGNPEACMGVALYLHGFGIPVSLVTMAKVHVWEEVKNVKDRVTGNWSQVKRIVMQEHYQIMLGLIHRAGHDTWLKDLDDTHATFGFIHKDHPGREQTFTYTWAMAERAGLTGKDNWARHPHYMLPAAAVRMTARFGCPEVLLGLGQNLDTDDAQVVELVKPPTGAARRPAAALASPPPQPERVYSGPQIIAMKCAEAGLDRDDELAYVSDVLGREVTTTKDLTPAEITKVLEHLELFAPISEEAAGPGKGSASTATAGGQESTPEAVPPPPAPPRRRAAPPTAGGVASSAASLPLDQWTGENWRAFLKERGVKVTELLKEAARVGKERSVSAPATLDDVTASGMADDLIGFVEELASERKA